MTAVERASAANPSAPTHDQPLASQAYQLLKRQIIRCELEPVLRVTEGELVERIGIGKTPVREALARLVQEGLVRNLPRRGYEIAPVTLIEVDELFGLRLIVEPAAARLAADRADGELLRRLDQLCGSYYDPADAESAAAFLSANHELHSTIARASGNRRLASIVESVLEGSERLFHLGLRIRNRTDEMAHEHHELVEALVAGDGDLAYEITAQQILSAQRMVIEAMVTSPSLQAVSITPKVERRGPVPRGTR